MNVASAGHEGCEQRTQAERHLLPPPRMAAECFVPRKQEHGHFCAAAGGDGRGDIDGVNRQKSLETIKAGLIPAARSSGGGWFQCSISDIR